MAERNGWAQAVGFNAMLVPPLALAFGTASGFYAANFILLLVIAPLAHGAFGNAGKQQREWSEAASTWLHRLPAVAATALLIAILVVALGTRWDSDPGPLVAAGASLWAAFAIGSCLAHDLLHRSSRFSRSLGRIVAGAIGYPFLEHEHQSHHRRSDWPLGAESLWAYTGRRLMTVIRQARERDLDAAAWAGRKFAGGLPLSISAFLLTAIGFALAGGTPALLCYLGSSIVLAWTVQAMTYLQHWGLGDDTLQPTHSGRQWSWEDVCMLQAWLTVGLSLHQGHHDREGQSFYRYEPVPDAPQLPGGYVPMLLISMVPPLWFRVMSPALDRWKSDPMAPALLSDRRLVCVPH